MIIKAIILLIAALIMIKLYQYLLSSKASNNHKSKKDFNPTNNKNIKDAEFEDIE